LVTVNWLTEGLVLF